MTCPHTKRALHNLGCAMRRRQPPARARNRPSFLKIVGDEFLRTFGQGFTPTSPLTPHRFADLAIPGAPTGLLRKNGPPTQWTHVLPSRCRMSSWEVQGMVCPQRSRPPTSTRHTKKEKPVIPDYSLSPHFVSGWILSGVSGTSTG